MTNEDHRLHFFPIAPHGATLTPGKPRWRAGPFKRTLSLSSQECSAILLALPNSLLASPATGPGDMITFSQQPGPRG